MFWTKKWEPPNTGLYTWVVAVFAIYVATTNLHNLVVSRKVVQKATELTTMGTRELEPNRKVFPDHYPSILHGCAGLLWLNPWHIVKYQHPS
jgi:hypothetical protein